MPLHNNAVDHCLEYNRDRPNPFLVGESPRELANKLLSNDQIHKDLAAGSDAIIGSYHSQESQPESVETSWKRCSHLVANRPLPGRKGRRYYRFGIH